MISKCVFIISFIFISNIFASEIVENNFDEANKIIDKKIKEYNPSEKYNIKLILKSLINTYKKRCNDKNIVFRSNINSDMPEFLYAYYGSAGTRKCYNMH